MNEQPNWPKPAPPSNASLIALFLFLLAAGCLLLLNSGCDPASHTETKPPANPPERSGPSPSHPTQLARSGSFDQAAAALEQALATGDLSSVTLPIRSFQAYRPATTDQVRRSNDLLRRYNELVERTSRQSRLAR